MIYSISRFLFHCFLKLFFKIEFEGKEAIPSQGPFILAANHYSHLDPPAIGVGCPRRLAYLAKEELFENKLFAWWAAKIGAIPLKRGTADITAVKQALKILQSKPLIIFPQGSRSPNLDKFTAGVGFLCKKAKVSVIAARIYGTDKIFPKGANFFHKGRIRVFFSKVDNIEEKDTYEDIASKVMERIKSL